jgi:hypothetical protein
MYNHLRFIIVTCPSLSTKPFATGQIIKLVLFTKISCDVFTTLPCPNVKLWILWTQAMIRITPILLSFTNSSIETNMFPIIWTNLIRNIAMYTGHTRMTLICRFVGTGAVHIPNRGNEEGGQFG